MNNIQVFSQVGMAAITGITAMFAGIIVTLYDKTSRAYKTKLEKELDQIIDASSGQVAASRARTLENPVPLSAVEGLVHDYHRQALSQAKIQFWFSITAATIGFIWILFAASNINQTNLISYLEIAPGAVIDIVAYLFFRQAEATRERATALYDRLRKDNLQSKAIKLVDSIENQQIKSVVKAQLSLHMAGFDKDISNLLDLFKVH